MDAVNGDSPPAKAGRPKGQTGTKDRIMDTAIDLFSRKGYEAVSVQEIAAAVGIKKSSIYSHFKSKDQILQSILSYFSKELARSDVKRLDEEKLIEICLDTQGPAALMAVAGKQFDDLMKTPKMRKIWRMIAMEIYRNAMIRSFFEREVIDRPVRFWEKAFRAMMKRGLIRQTDVGHPRPGVPVVPGLPAGQIPRALQRRRIGSLLHGDRERAGGAYQVLYGNAEVTQRFLQDFLSDCENNALFSHASHEMPARSARAII